MRSATSALIISLCTKLENPWRRVLENENPPPFARERKERCKREYLGGISQCLGVKGCTPSERGCTRITCLHLLYLRALPASYCRLNRFVSINGDIDLAK